MHIQFAMSFCAHLRIVSLRVWVWVCFSFSRSFSFFHSIKPFRKYIYYVDNTMLCLSRNHLKTSFPPSLLSLFSSSSCDSAYLYRIKSYTKNMTKDTPYVCVHKYNGIKNTHSGFFSRLFILSFWQENEFLLACRLN